LSYKSDKDLVKEYKISLIAGVILLYVLWQAVITLTVGLSQLHKFGIGIAATVVLIAVVNRDRAKVRMG